MFRLSVRRAVGSQRAHMMMSVPGSGMPEKRLVRALRLALRAASVAAGLTVAGIAQAQVPSPVQAGARADAGTEGAQNLRRYDIPARWPSERFRRR